LDKEIVQNVLIKKVGKGTNKHKREDEEEDKEKYPGPQTMIDSSFKKELKVTRGQGSSKPPKRGFPNPLVNDENSLLELQRPRERIEKGISTKFSKEGIPSYPSAPRDETEGQ
jgi:hypothetical protein